ncbi:hypothetical protein VB711_03900 [Cronbergia sp. UHCC 0137]|nr:hypothetical protein [Cronbergia sp. UHCC 0137]MEA5616988.1 hypothetical protein [Cronbergia sp. UHCC 0137]
MRRCSCGFGIAAIEAFEGRYEVTELAGMVERDSIIAEAMSLIQQESEDL